MDFVHLSFTFMLSIINYKNALVSGCPAGCSCSLFHTNCCLPGQYLQIPLVGFENTTKLILNNCPSLTISTQFFQNLNTLEEIIIEKTVVKYIDGHAFVDLSKMKSLVLTELNLSKSNLHPSAFNDLQVEYLSLNSNNLCSISRYMFSGLKNLRTLDLSRNKISLIHDQAFENLFKLSVLNLDYNYLETVTPLWFNTVRNSSLKISLIGNNLTNECRFRGVELSENQWFMKSLKLNDSLIINRSSVPSCSAPSFKDLYQETYVRESSSIVMICSANGIPKPSLRWLLPKGLEITSPIYPFSISNGNLKIAKVQPGHSGLYACLATNSEGSKVSLTKLLVIPNTIAAITTNLTTPRTAARKASLILLIIFITILGLSLFIVFVYLLKIVFNWIKKKTNTTDFEFSRFVDTPNILPVPENPQPMPHL